MTRFSFVLLAATLACGASGCGDRRPIAAIPIQSQSQPAVEQFDFQPYLRAFRLGRWEYRRQELQGSQESPTHIYPRDSGVQRMSEGNLVGRNFLPLADYLCPAESNAATTDRRRPMPPLKGGTAFLFKLSEPLEPFPLNLKPGQPIVSTSPLRYYDYDGRPLAPGTLTREVEIEGIEDIDGPGGRFPRCVRVRVELEVRVSWVLHMYWTSYLWISAQVGEVRRLQSMSGRFVIFLFSSTCQYDLAAGQTMLEGPQPADMTPKWEYGAVLLDRVVPRPRIAGMVIDYAESSPVSPASVPATMRTEPPPASQPSGIGETLKRKSLR